MAFYLITRGGADKSERNAQQMREVLAHLDIEDIEHQCVSVRHEFEWCLGAYRCGLLTGENVEVSTELRHLNYGSRERVLALWLLLSRRELDEIEGEPWLPGYEDRRVERSRSCVGQSYEES